MGEKCVTRDHIDKGSRQTAVQGTKRIRVLFFHLQFDFTFPIRCWYDFNLRKSTIKHSLKSGKLTVNTHEFLFHLIQNFIEMFRTDEWYHFLDNLFMDHVAGFDRDKISTFENVVDQIEKYMKVTLDTISDIVLTLSIFYFWIK